MLQNHYYQFDNLVSENALYRLVLYTFIIIKRKFLPFSRQGRQRSNSFLFPPY
jgi:hypothetical protein